MNPPYSPLISIVIPTYNRADLIPKAIQSVLDQTYQNWELIIVDNYSDDGTKEVIESFKDSRISMLLLPRTGSVAASRNMGVHHSKGEWVAFLDSDDWWFPTKLSSVCEVINTRIPKSPPTNGIRSHSNSVIVGVIVFKIKTAPTFVRTRFAGIINQHF